MADACKTRPAPPAAEDLLNRAESLTKASAELAWTLTVFGLHQGLSAVRSLPRLVPPAAAEELAAAAKGPKSTFDRIDDAVFEVPNEVQKAMIEMGFRLLRPSGYTPRGLLATGVHALLQGLGIASRLLPGARSGASTGWGPVGGDKG